MDAETFDQLRALWPDVAAPFSRILPDGAQLSRTIDEWRPGSRVRTVEAVRGERCPELEELLEEAREDAERRGWTADDDHPGTYELEGVVLRLGTAVTKRGPVLKASFEQTWPKDAGAPVETSETFQKMTREALSLGGEPLSLKKEIIVDPFQLSRADSVRERVELPLDPELIRRFPKIGFTYDEALEAWTMGSIFGDYEMIARVRESFDRVSVEVTKTRIRH